MILYIIVLLIFLSGFLIANIVLFKTIFPNIKIGITILFPLSLMLGLLISQFMLKKKNRYLYSLIINYGYLTLYFGFAWILIIPLTNNKILFLIIGLIISTYSIFESLQIKIKTITLRKNPKLKIAHISDLHISGINPKDKIRRIIPLLKKINPDLILITGDLIDKPAPPKNILKFFKEIKIPIYFVLGNHDLYFNEKEIKEYLKNSNIITIRNKKISFKNIDIYGIDDTKKPRESRDLMNNFNLNKNKYNILMNHKPDNVEVAEKMGFNLMLAGHTHGGQIVPTSLLVNLLFKHYKGFKKINNMYLNINPGTLLFGTHWRLFTKNEITIFRI